MNTRLNTLPTITGALLMAIFMFSFWPAAAVATGGHQDHNDKEWSDKDRFTNSHSKKRETGKSCPKKACDNMLSVPLYVEGDKRVGKVTIRLDGGDLKVSYQVNDGWYIKQTNLDLSNEYSGLLRNADGSPDVENYPYSSKHFTPVKSADYIISANQWPLGTNLYVAAQAVVISKTDGKCKQHSATSKHGNTYDEARHNKYQTKKSRGKKNHSDHDDFFKKESGYHKYARASYDDDDHKDGHHNRDDHGDTMEQEAWALGEKFPGQTLAGYFIYKLESCDPIQQSTIQFGSPIYTMNEEGPAVEITVVRSGNLSLAASVDLTTMDVSATNGADYVITSESGVVRFEPNQSIALVTISPLEDTDVEPVETATLQLSNPSGATLGAQDTAILEINDNDVVSAAVIAIDRIEVNGMAVNEVFEGDTVTIYITRTGDLSVDATVAYGTIDGTATGSAQCLGGATPFDYEDAAGTLFFDAGVVELPIEVMTCINSPRDDAPLETLDIEIYNPIGAVLADDGDGDPNSNSATITIKEGS